MKNQPNPSILLETALDHGQIVLLIDYGVRKNSCRLIAFIKDGSIKVELVMVNSKSKKNS